LTYETDYVYDLIIANYFHNVSLNIHRITLPSPGFVCWLHRPQSRTELHHIQTNTGVFRSIV